MARSRGFGAEAGVPPARERRTSSVMSDVNGGRVDRGGQGVEDRLDHRWGDVFIEGQAIAAADQCCGRARALSLGSGCSRGLAQIEQEGFGADCRFLCSGSSTCNRRDHRNGGGPAIRAAMDIERAEQAHLQQPHPTRPAALSAITVSGRFQRGAISTSTRLGIGRHRRNRTGDRAAAQVSAARRVQSAS